MLVQKLIFEFDNFDNPKLRVIAIGGNSGLKTTLPDFNLPLLEEVYTYGDSLNGPLPQWENVPNLRDAYIYDNPYNDTIPDWGLDSLKNLSLYNCGLTGDLPILENSTKLFSFYVDDNGLEGEIPEYTDKTELDTLVLRNNNLSGCVDIERYCGIGWFTGKTTHFFLIAVILIRYAWVWNKLELNVMMTMNLQLMI